MGETLGKGIKTAAKWGAGIAVAAGAAGTALFAVATKAAEATDNIDKMSQKLGMSRKGYQEWDYVLSQSGTSIDSMTAGMKTLTNQVDDLAAGGSIATDAFGELGLSYEDLAGLTQEEIFEKTLTALQGVEDTTKRAAIANDLLGRSGAELAPLLNTSAESIEEMKQKANDLGMVLSDDAIDAGVNFTDTMDTLKRSLGAIGTNIGAELMPMFISLADWITEHMPEIKETIQGVADKVTTVISNLKAFWDENGPTIIEIATGVFDKIKIAVQGAINVVKIIIDWMIKYQDILIPLAAGIGGVVVAIGAYSLAITIATAATSAFAAVMAFVTSPIGIVVLAIGALIAVGVLLYKNWDKIKEFASGLWDKIKEVFGNIKEYISTAFTEIKNKIIETLDNIIIDLKNFVTDFKDKGKEIIQGVWDGMKEIWTKLTEWVSEKVSWIADKLSFWNDSKDEMNESDVSTTVKSSSASGSHAGGLSYVPYDGYTARLHQGEAIVPAKQAAETSLNLNITLEAEGTQIYTVVKKIQKAMGADLTDAEFAR